MHPKNAHYSYVETQIKLLWITALDCMEDEIVAGEFCPKVNILILPYALTFSDSYFCKLRMTISGADFLFLFIWAKGYHIIVTHFT